jgi:hypothetical protein
MLAVGEGPEALDAKIKSELALWARVMPSIGIQPE